MASPSTTPYPHDTDCTDLFLIGKTGHGKSATGNSILGRSAFNTSDGGESDTWDIQVGWARRLGRKVKVVDGPGIRENRLGGGRAAEKLVKDMGEGILQCPKGFNALVLVLKYGNRFTREEAETVESLKLLFGTSFIRQFCIIVFTHGENFDMYNRSHGRDLSFDDWCRRQTGAIRPLLEECNYRAVLFNNMERDRCEAQLGKLLETVDSLQNGGKRYTSQAFDKFAKEREKLIVLEKAPVLREEIQSKIDVLVDDANSLKQIMELDEEVTEKVEQFKKDARNLREEIVEQDKNTGVLQHLDQAVVNLQHNVENHMIVLNSTLEHREKENALQIVQAKYDDTLKQLKEEQKKRKTGWGRILAGVLKSIAAFFVSPVLGILVIANEIAEMTS